MPDNQTVELFTLYALGVSFTILRTYARIVAVGIRDLRVDDYLIWLAMVCVSSGSSVSGYGKLILDPRRLSTLRNALLATTWELQPMVLTTVA